MPIGPITPGTYVDVSVDASPTLQTDTVAPTATMPVTAADIQALTLLLLNNDKCKLSLTGGTLTGDLNVSGHAITCASLTAGTVSAAIVAATYTQVGPIQYLSAGNHTLDNVTAGQIIWLPQPTGAVTITLKQTGGTAPVDGAWFEIWVPLNGIAHVIAIDREGASGTHVATLWDGSSMISNNQAAGARVQMQGGVWRLRSLLGTFSFYGNDA